MAIFNVTPRAQQDNQTLLSAAFADKRVLDVHWRMAKDPSSHMCLVQHKICVGGREKGRKVYLLYWRVEVTAVSRENTLLMMETLKSIVSLHEASCKWELAKRKREWQRGIMRWSGWRRQLYIVQWEWERVAEEKKRVKYRNRSQFDSCIIADYSGIEGVQKRFSALKPGVDQWEGDARSIQ